MAIKLKTKCPNCNQSLRIDKSRVGKNVRCPACRERFVVSSVQPSGRDSIAPSQEALETQASVGDGTSPGAGSDTSVSQIKPTPTIGQIGRFQLKAALGQGAFGTVYRAYDPVLDREVALKVPKFATNDKRKIRRFIREAKAAASLHHPNIVAVFESGEVGGQTFIASECVDGTPMSVRIEQDRPDYQQSAQWVSLLAEAMAYAHKLDIVHRDIKPDNIMVNQAGQPQIMDFGLAKRMDEDSSMTADGGVLGTPAYMPPEQARGDLENVGPHSDQYSLGVVLYELLTGRRPFSGPPHSVVAMVASEDPTEPRQIDPNIPVDLAAICSKAMEKEPTRRYADMTAMANDLSNWLSGEETSARPISRMERYIRWCRRNPLVASLLALIATITLAIAVISPIVAARQFSLREEADESLQGFLEQKEVAEKSLTLQYMNQGRLLSEQGDSALGSLWLLKALKGVSERTSDLSVPIRNFLGINLSSMHRLQNIVAHQDEVTAVEFSPNGKYCATVTGGFYCTNGQLTVRSLSTWDVLFEPITLPNAGWSVDFSQDSSKIAVGSGTFGRGEVQVFASESGKQLAGPLPHKSAVLAVKFDMPGTAIVAGGRDKMLRHWSLVSGGSLSYEASVGSDVNDIAIHPAGQVVAIATSAPVGQIEFRNISTGNPSPIHKPIQYSAGTGAIAYSPDGKQIVSGEATGSVHVWDVGQDHQLDSSLLHESAVLSVDFSPDARFVVSADSSGNVVVWNPATGSQIGQRLHHRGAVHTAVVAPDGAELLTGAEDGNARYWEVTLNSEPAQSIVCNQLTQTTDFSPDGELLGIGQRASEFVIYRVDKAEEIATAKQNGGFGVAFVGPQKMLKGSLHTRQVQFIDTATGREFQEPLTHNFKVVDLAVAADGNKLVVGTGKEDGSVGEAVIWDLTSRQQLCDPIVHESAIVSVAINRDSRLFATGSSDGDVRVFDMATTTEVYHSTEPKGWTKALQFVQDGTYLVSGSYDGLVRLWDMTNPGQDPRRGSVDVKSRIEAIRVAPGDRTILIGTSVGNVYFWDTRTQQHSGFLRCLPGIQLHDLDISSDGTRLATGNDHTVHLWEMPKSTTADVEALEKRIQIYNGVQLTESGERRLLSLTEWKQLSE